MGPILIRFSSLLCSLPILDLMIRYDTALLIFLDDLSYRIAWNISMKAKVMNATLIDIEVVKINPLSMRSW